ncbi:MAG: histidine--tRNA ligase [Peptococcaceae bacterium]|nr:histidine--tRNA ligase [Peptococcaceae bacterium]
MKVNANPAKGMRDFLPSEVRLRKHLETTIADVYERQGFAHIETPVLENIEMLTKSEGGENLQLIFKVLKRRDKLRLDTKELCEADLTDLGLRYDLTLPLSRFYAKNQDKLPSPFKALQIGTVFRAERQQRGRYRAFTQCDVDIIGDSSTMAECEVILSTIKALLALGLRDFKVKISDRRILAAVVHHFGLPESSLAEIAVILDKADKIGWPAVEEEMVKLGLPEEEVKALLTTISELTIDKLGAVGVPSDTCLAMRQVISVITEQAGGSYESAFCPTLVRGMGYYTGTVFEIEATELGLAIAGGGRYDRMIGQWLGHDVPAVGFSIGFERILLLLQEKGFVPPKMNRSIAYLYQKDLDPIDAVITGADTLRREGHNVNVLPLHKKLGKQLSQLESTGYDGYFLSGGVEVNWFMGSR